MSRPFTYFAQAPDGTVITRQSHRAYTHAVLVGPAEPPSPHRNWGAWSFNGRHDLALRELVRAQRAWETEGAPVVCVPVSTTHPLEPEHELAGPDDGDTAHYLPREADRVRRELRDDPAVSNEDYGRLVDEADQADQARELEAERPDDDEPRPPIAWDDHAAAYRWAVHGEHEENRRVIRRELVAELELLTRFDTLRAIAGHDYGAGQRAHELSRRRRELRERYPRITEHEPASADELAAAFERVGRPRFERAQAQPAGDGTPRTIRAWERLEREVQFRTASEGSERSVACS